MSLQFTRVPAHGVLPAGPLGAGRLVVLVDDVVLGVSLELVVGVGAAAAVVAAEGGGGQKVGLERSDVLLQPVDVAGKSAVK